MACGGRYDVGAMDSHETGGTSSAAGSTGSTMSGTGTAGSATGSAGQPMMVGLGGTSSAGPGMASDALGPSCVAPGSPPALMGAFLEPKVVWDRIRTLTGSQLLLPPAGFPATTTYVWAGDMVQVAIEDAKEAKEPRAAVAFLQQWLELQLNASPSALLQGPWAQALFSNPPVTVDQLRMLREGSTCDIQPMIRVFGITPRGFQGCGRT